MAESDHEQLARELDQESDKLAREGERIEQQIDETRADWKRKQADPQVPGAKPPDDE